MFDTRCNMEKQIVRCNMCMKTFDESEILYNPVDNVEACPYCHRSGYLMDLSDEDVALIDQEDETDECHDCEYKGDACRNQCMELKSIYNPNLR